MERKIKTEEKEKQKGRIYTENIEETAVISESEDAKWKALE